MSAMATPDISGHAGSVLFQAVSEGTSADSGSIDPAKLDFSALLQAQLQPQHLAKNTDFALGLRQNEPLEAGDDATTEKSDSHEDANDEAESFAGTTIPPLILVVAMVPITPPTSQSIAANSIAQSNEPAGQTLSGATLLHGPDAVPELLSAPAHQAFSLSIAPNTTTGRAQLPPVVSARSSPENPPTQRLVDAAPSSQNIVDARAAQTPIQPIARITSLPEPGEISAATNGVSMAISTDQPKTSPIRGTKIPTTGQPSLANSDANPDASQLALVSQISAGYELSTKVSNRNPASNPGDAVADSAAWSDSGKFPTSPSAASNSAPPGAANVPEFPAELRAVPHPGPLRGARSVNDPVPGRLAIDTQALGPVTIGIAATSVGSDALRVSFAVDHIATAQLISDASVLLGQRLEQAGARLEALSVDVRSEHLGGEQRSNDQRQEQRQAGEFQQNPGQNSHQGEPGNAEHRSGARANPPPVIRTDLSLASAHSITPPTRVARDRFA